MKRQTMKMRSVVMLFFLFLVSSYAFAQSNLVSINVRNATLMDVFSIIEKQTTYRFSYLDAIIDSRKDVTVNMTRSKVSDVLDHCLSGHNLSYEIVSERSIVITKKAQSTQKPEKKSKAVSGKVVFQDGEPVIGASIVINGSSVGAISDVDGNFSVDVENSDVLSISYIGMVTQRVTYNGQKSLTITMHDDSAGLEEVVVVGYGSQKKVSITGAVGNVKTDRINRLANSTTASMQGTTPGLTILDKGGSPGESSTTLRVRGITTINNSDALLLVDGVEQRISDINPDDIESISILKDASTTAIYGSRAANGVVLVTTKRAKEGKPIVTFGSYWGIQKVTDKPEHMETVTYMRQQNQAFINNGGTPRYSETFIQEWIDNHEKDPYTYREANAWQDVMYHSALQQNYNLSASGGSDKARGLMSIRYYNQDGVIDNFNSDTKDIRVNTDLKPFKGVTLSADANYRTTHSKQPYGAFDYDNGGGGIFYSMYHAAQFVVPQYADGSYGLGNKNANPLMLARMNGDVNNYRNLFIGNVKLEAEIFDGLKFTAQYAQRLANNKRISFQNKYKVVDTNFLDWGATAKDQPYTPNVNRSRTRNITKNSLTDYRTDIDEYTLNLLVNYHKRFGNHDVSALGGFSQIDNKYSESTAYRENFYNNNVRSINMGDESTQKSSGYNTEYALQSWFGRVNYNYNDIYLLEANIRYDGTSRFTGDNQFGWFPSFSAGWRVSNESFWSDQLRNIVSDLKIRASWGKTGNQTAGLYAFYDSYTSTSYNFGGNLIQGYLQTTLANKDLRWETSTQTDFGIDAQFLGGKLSVTADYYYKKTDGILVSLPIAGIIGLNAPTQNAATVENKGFEFGAEWRDNIGEISYSLNFNISNNWNKVLDLGGANPTVSGGQSDVVTTVREGYAINSYWGYTTDGLLTAEDVANGYPTLDSRMQEGDIKYVDISGPDGKPDGVIDENDKTVIGNEFPRYPFAFGGNVQWRNFDFAFQLQGVIDAETRVSGALCEGGNFEGFVLDIFKDYWTEDNLDARFPRPHKSVDFNSYMSDYWVIDAGYLRLKTLQLGYTLPSNITKKIGCEKARVYVAGSNLLTFSPLKEWGLDPEFVSGRFLYYPQTAVYTIGVNLTF